MFFNDMEKVIKSQGEAGLCHLLHYYGMELELFRQSKANVHSRVHGRNAGQPEKIVKTFVGVLQGDDFFESNTTLSPSFEAGFLYTDESEIFIGDVILIVSDDTRHRKYKITAMETIGLTTTVFKKWKLASMG